MPAMCDVNITKSYKTLDNLENMLKKLGFDKNLYVVVHTKEGRYTAVFPQSQISDGDVTKFARHGFITIG